MHRLVSHDVIFKSRGSISQVPLNKSIFSWFFKMNIDGATHYSPVNISLR